MSSHPFADMVAEAVQTWIGNSDPCDEMVLDSDVCMLACDVIRKGRDPYAYAAGIWGVDRKEAKLRIYKAVWGINR